MRTHASVSNASSLSGPFNKKLSLWLPWDLKFISGLFVKTLFCGGGGVWLLKTLQVDVVVPISFMYR